VVAVTSVYVESQVNAYGTLPKVSINKCTPLAGSCLGLFDFLGLTVLECPFVPTFAF